MHEFQTAIFESREGGFGEPETGHVGAELHLVALFLVGCAGGRADLRLGFPTGVFGREGDEGFGGGGEGEEGLREGEDGVDGGEGDAVVG